MLDNRGYKMTVNDMISSCTTAVDIIEIIRNGKQLFEGTYAQTKNGQYVDCEVTTWHFYVSTYYGKEFNKLTFYVKSE